MKLGLLHSEIMTIANGELGRHEYEIDIPSEVNVMISRKEYLIRFIQDCFIQAAVDTKVPLNERKWYFIISPEAQATYDLPRRIIS